MAQLTLIIDDSLTIRKILEVCLHRAGYQVKTFSDAVEVFDWLRTAETAIPALMFVDIGLPRMDGYTLIQRLRARPALAQTVFIIISSRCGVLDRLKARLVGAHLSLAKPLRTQEVERVVQQYLGSPMDTNDHRQAAWEAERISTSGGRT